MPIHEIVNGAMKGKFQEKLIKIAGIKSIEETHLTDKHGRFLFLTLKLVKTQVKREVESIIQRLHFKSCPPYWEHIPEYCRKPSETQYFSLTQQLFKKKLNQSHKWKILFYGKNNKRNYIVLFSNPCPQIFPKLPTI